MSADGYSVCPKCQRAKDEGIAKARIVVESKYGEVSQEEYKEASDTVNSESIELPKSLREDYEFFLNGEKLNISYSGNCHVCKFSYSFEKEVNILKGEE